MPPFSCSLRFLLVLFVKHCQCGDVIDISSKSDFLKGNEITLLQFHAPWCRPCDRLKAGYKLLAGQLGTIALAKVVRVAIWDVEEEGNEEFAETMGARPDSTWNLPHIVLLKGSTKLATFGDDRDISSLTSFVMASQRSRIVSLPDAQAIHDFVEACKPTVVLLGMYNKFQQSSENSAFYTAAALLQLGDVPPAYFAITTNEDATKELGASSPSIMLMRAGIGEPNLPMENDLIEDAGEIFKFVELNRAPLLIYTAHKQSSQYMSESANQQRFMVFLNDIEDASMLEVVKQVAQKFRKYCLTVLVGSSETALLDEYQLAVSDYQPARVLFRDFSRYGQRRVWSMPDTANLSEDSMSNFLQNVFNGTIPMDDTDSPPASPPAIDSSSPSPEVEKSEASDSAQPDDPYDEL